AADPRTRRTASTGSRGRTASASFGRVVESLVERVVAQVLREVTHEVADDEPVAEAPVAVDLLEGVVVPTGDHALQRQRGRGLVHGEHRPRAGHGTVVVELDDGVVGDVLRPQR